MSKLINGCQKLLLFTVLHYDETAKYRMSVVRANIVRANSRRSKPGQFSILIFFFIVSGILCYNHGI